MPSFSVWQALVRMLLMAPVPAAKLRSVISEAVKALDAQGGSTNSPWQRLWLAVTWWHDLVTSGDVVAAMTSMRCCLGLTTASLQQSTVATLDSLGAEAGALVWRAYLALLERDGAWHGEQLLRYVEARLSGYAADASLVMELELLPRLGVADTGVPFPVVHGRMATGGASEALLNEGWRRAVEWCHATPTTTGEQQREASQLALCLLALQRTSRSSGSQHGQMAAELQRLESWCSSRSGGTPAMRAMVTYMRAEVLCKDAKAAERCV